MGTKGRQGMMDRAKQLAARTGKGRTTPIEKYHERALQEERETMDEKPDDMYTLTRTTRQSFLTPNHASVAFLDHPENTPRPVISFNAHSQKLPNFLSSKYVPSYQNRMNAPVVSPQSMIPTNFWEQQATLPTSSLPPKALAGPEEGMGLFLNPVADALALPDTSHAEPAAAPAGIKPYMPNYASSGLVYRVRDRVSKTCGWGVQHSAGGKGNQLGVTVFEWGVDLDGPLPGKEYWKAKILEAYELRLQTLNLANNSGYRLVNGMGDFIPGLIADVYGPAAVVVTDDPAHGAYAALREVLEAVGVKHILVTDASNRNFIKSAGKYLQNAPENSHIMLPSRHWDVGGVASVQFTENGIRYVWKPSLVEHAHTGHYFRHRTVKQLLMSVAKDKSVLDLFAGTGGFGIAAAVAGAAKVTFVETDPEYCKAIGQNLSLQMPEEDWSTFCRIEQLRVHEVQIQTRFDIVVMDPPDIVTNPHDPESQELSPSHKKYYRTALGVALRRVARGGKLFCILNNVSIDLPNFTSFVAKEAQKQYLSLSVIRTITTPPDFPSNVALKRPGYLGIVMQVS
eukprot:TRINITY_DN8129_c0_g1_i4.p1 TRINITY_DN8129_c0_g1~~TRINITY_DN8129_c0_g1_i4.p1  ORF type:complete len:620 (+),score=135.75 TRINITY_DN8129_c0_g1_i4:159-1862(+)